MSATRTASRPARSAAPTRARAAQLAGTEYGRWVAQLRRLDAGDWTRPTDCPGWDVRAMAGHVLGMAEMVASPRELLRQNLMASRAGGGIDALTALQVREHAHLSAAEVVTRTATVAARAVRGRARLSRIGRLPIPEAQVVGEEQERWTLGFLVDVVLTRDTWMHRMDVARATGREPELTAGHDGVIVADVVAEWSGRHGRAYRLRLTGPAGGAWSSGAGGDDLTLDAVEFCRLLSGRPPARPGVAATGLLTQQVPF